MDRRSSYQTIHLIIYGNTKKKTSRNDVVSFLGQPLIVYWLRGPVLVFSRTPSDILLTVYAKITLNYRAFPCEGKYIVEPGGEVVQTIRG